jgi:2-phospho-L-lactate transferase/gluconeogenesis factor (CofD/UPF0052 family)
VKARAQIGHKVRRSIEEADLICYPMGSFYSSVVANLLPEGVGRAIAAARSPRVYVPNTGVDPEQAGMSVADTLDALIRYTRADAGQDVPVGRIVNLVLLDHNHSHYGMKVDIERLERLGVQVISLELVNESSEPHASAQRLTEALLSVA